MDDQNDTFTGNDADDIPELMTDIVELSEDSLEFEDWVEGAE